jgi:N-acetylmuramoyl-L-alanine amidase
MASFRPVRFVSLVAALPLVAAATLSAGFPTGPLPASVPVLAAGETPVEPPAEAAEASRPAPKYVLRAATPRLARKGTQRVLDVEQRLSELGYWTGPIDGVLDPASRLAVVAFQKVEGRKRTGQLNSAEIDAVLAARRPVPLEGGPAHLEVDLGRQVLYFVGDGGEVERVIAVSTGNNKDFVHKGVRDRAYTPRGRWTVYRKILGMRKAPLGDIYFPSYLVGGIAIHGSPSIPAYPASHGCVRVPMWAAKEISELTPGGTTVLIHEAGSFENDVRWQSWAKRARPENVERAGAGDDVARVAAPTST